MRNLRLVKAKKSSTTTTRITRSKNSTELKKTSESTKVSSPRKPAGKLSTKKIDLVQLSPCVTRSKHALEPVNKSESLVSPTPRVVLQKVDRKVNLAKLSPRVTRSKEKKTFIHPVPVVPAVQPAKLKIVKKVDYKKI